MADLFAHEDTKPTHELSVDELRLRIGDYLRFGRITADVLDVSLGFVRAYKRGWRTDGYLYTIREVVRTIRYEDGTEDLNLLDDDDTDERQAVRDSREQMWDDF